MNRKRRLFAAVIVIVLIAIGVEILIESIAADGLLRFVESRLAAETDLEVRFGDDFHLEILPVLRFEANSVTVTDPQRPSIPLLTVGTLLLEIDPVNLLSGVVAIDELEFIDSELTLDWGAVSDGQLMADVEELVELESEEPSGEDPFFQIRQLDAAPLSMVVHVGDILWYPCSDQLYRERLASFHSQRHPLIYTPGDNDWTDCHEPIA